MFISLAELELNPVEFAQELAPGAIDFGPDMEQQAPLKVRGRAEMLREHQGHGHRGETIDDIRIVGSLKTQVGVACARCLEPVSQPVERQFDLLYRPQGADAGRDEISVTQAEAEIGYYTGEGVELEDVLREQVLLSVPIKVVCSEGCKGLCPHCGTNLNHGTCDCKNEQADPRWDALKEIRDKLQS